MFSSTQPDFPSNSQKWLLDRMTTLGYKPNPLGACFGVSHMAMQASLANEFQKFYRRLQLINYIPIDEFSATIEKIKDKRAKLVEVVKNKNIKAFKLFSKLQLEKLENDPIISIQISDIKKMIAESSLNEQEKIQEYERRKNDWLLNSFLQMKIDEAILQLPLDEQLKFDIPIFFESVELYQQPYLYGYPHIFTETKHTSIQDFDISVPLCLSKQLQQEGGIVQAANDYTGVYDTSSLKGYLECLINAINHANPRLQHPLQLILQSINHAITVSIDPVNSSIRIINMSEMKLAAQTTTDTHIAANQLNSALNHPNAYNCIFSTKLFATKSDQASLDNIIQQLENNDNWQGLHEVTAKKSQGLDHNHSNWLCLAVKRNDIKLVKQLLSEQADVNVHVLPNNLTPLHAAVENGNIELVKLLLAAGAEASINTALIDPVAMRVAGHTPLYFAVVYNHPEIVKLLLAAKADPEAKFIHAQITNHTSLHLAILCNYPDIVKILLQANANPNAKTEKDITPLTYAIACKRPEIAKILLQQADADPNLASNGVPPIFYAAQEGCQEIVGYLLEHEKINLTQAFISTAEKLRSFAKNRNVEQAMQAFLQERISSDNDQEEVSMTALDIARIMGNDEIANMLQNAGKYNQTTASEKAFKFRYERHAEYPELSELFLQHHHDESFFNRCLDISKEHKTKDNLPEVVIDGKQAGHAGYYLVKLPVNDPHLFILGHLTNSYHSINNYRKECIIDALRQENNGYYVLLKSDSSQPPIIDGKLNSACQITAAAYTWLNKDKSALVLSSLDGKDSAIFESLLPAFCKQLTNQTTVFSVLIPGEDEDPQAVLAEEMPEGNSSHYTESQCLFYQNPEKLVQFKEDLFARWDKLDKKPFSMNFEEFCKFIKFDKLSSARELDLIEKIFLNPKVTCLASIFNEKNISDLFEKSNLTTKLIFQIMAILMDYGLFNETHAPSLANYLSNALTSKPYALKKNLDSLSFTEKEIKELLDSGLLTNDICEEVIAKPQALHLILGSLKELNQEGLLNKAHAKILFEGPDYYQSIVGGIKLLDQKNLLTEENLQQLSKNSAYALPTAKKLVESAQSHENKSGFKK